MHFICTSFPTVTYDYYHVIERRYSSCILNIEIANTILEYFSSFMSFVREVKHKMRSKHGKRITIVKNHHPTHLCLLQGKPKKSFTIFGKFIENDFIIMRIIFRDSNWVVGSARGFLFRNPLPYPT